MQDTTFIGLDVHKATISVAVARGERGGEVRIWESVPHRADHIRKLRQGRQSPLRRHLAQGRSRGRPHALRAVVLRPRPGIHSALATTRRRQLELSRVVQRKSAKRLSLIHI